MKKLVKWSVILGSIFCLLGTGIITAGAMMGGMDELKMRLEHETLQPWKTYVEPWEAYVEPGGNAGKSGGNHSHPWAGDVRPGSEELPLESVYRYEGVRSLSVEVGAGSVELWEMEELAENEIALNHYGDGNQYRIEQEGGELNIDLPNRKDVTQGMETLVIGVPTGFQFEELNIETKAGAFYSEQVLARELALEVSAGEIRILGGSAEHLEAEAKAGAIDCQMAVEKTASAECSAGTVDILLAGEKNDYDYQLECSGGSIFLNGEEPEEFTQLYQKKNINNHAGRNVELECQMGTITVDFQTPVV